MFGSNPIRKLDRATDSLEVHSVFPTIQGEGPFAGRAAIFLRLGGCSLACSWCDTEFEEGKRRISNADIIDLLYQRLTHRREKLCVITGGEPLRQDLSSLVSGLVAEGWQVQVETAGIHWWPDLDLWVRRPDGQLLHDGPLTIVCSPKTPKVNVDLAYYCIHWKYIIDAREEADPDDGLPRFAVSQAHQPVHGRLYRPPWQGRMIYVQPLDVGDAAHNQLNRERCVALTLKYGYRLSLQQHKMLGLP